MEALNQDCKTVTLVLPFNVEEKNHFSKTSTKMGSEANHSRLYTGRNIKAVVFPENFIFSSNRCFKSTTFYIRYLRMRMAV